MDNDLIAVEYLKMYFNSHPEEVPKDSDEAFELFQKMHKRFKGKILTAFKQKSEKYVDKFFDDKKKGYL